MPAASSWANPSGSAAAAFFILSRVCMSRRLCCFCSWSIEMAERNAMTSGFSLSDIGTGGGSGAKSGCLGGPLKMLETPPSWGGLAEEEGEESGGTIGFPPGTGARCAKTGVTGEYGGRGGVPGRSLLWFSSWPWDCSMAGYWALLSRSQSPWSQLKVGIFLESRDRRRSPAEQKVDVDRRAQTAVNGKQATAGRCPRRACRQRRFTNIHEL